VPAIDGDVLTEQLATAFATGKFNKVPVIDGSNHDEYRRCSWHWTSTW
jgi:para-nitrobenzyl esterase